MTTLLVTQPNGHAHLMPPGQPERPERLDAIDRVLGAASFDPLVRKAAEPADLALADLVHVPGYLDRIRSARPAEGFGQLAEDTFLSPGSIDAAATALGAGLMALEAVMSEGAENAFCAVRPPGHHAESNRAMGFCLINTVAILARQAQREYDVERVAIVDFDVHHGNGTQEIFWDEPSVLYASSHQMPLYPGTGKRGETGAGNIVNTPLDPGSGREMMREAYNETILMRLVEFQPDLILVSAGFDADYRDPLADLQWRPEDYGWLTGRLMDVAEHQCGSRVISMLEGGYDLDGLAEGVSAHVHMLLHGTSSSD